jgi:hypothetical protein
MRNQACSVRFKEPARPLLIDDWYSERLDKSAIHNGFGLGHSGSGGQLIWADSASDTVIAINSQLASELPAPSTTSTNSTVPQSTSRSTTEWPEPTRPTRRIHHHDVPQNA